MQYGHEQVNQLGGFRAYLRRYAWRELGSLVRDAEALYLDPKQSALAALSIARAAARKEVA